MKIPCFSALIFTLTILTSAQAFTPAQTQAPRSLNKRMHSHHNAHLAHYHVARSHLQHKKQKKERQAKSPKAAESQKLEAEAFARRRQFEEEQMQKREAEKEKTKLRQYRPHEEKPNAHVKRQNGASITTTSTTTSSAAGPTQTSYNYLGCAAEGTNGRLLNTASTTSSSMTTDMCAAFCAAGQYAYMGTEYGSECYCSNFLNGVGTVGQSGCTMKCSGAPGQICGGPNRLSLYNNPAWNPLPPVLPVGWYQYGSGCYAELASGRLLNKYSYTSTTNTIQTCLNTCKSKGYDVAGLEYGSECYCSSIVSLLAANPTISNSCNMACSGNNKNLCGGSLALNIYWAPVYAK